MKCLVTGGAGFIGSHITEALVNSGHKVRVLDNLSTGNKNNLSVVLSRIEYQQGDITHPDDVAKAVEGQDLVFHQAALRSVARSVDSPFLSNEINVDGTLRLLEGCRKSKSVKRVVYASSSSVYGDNMQYPQIETMRASPISPYAVSKLAGEHYHIVYAKTFGLETVSLRYFNVFGPRQQPESQYAAVIPKFMQAALLGKPLEVHSDGEQSRDFTFIEDVVQANLLAATRPGIAGEFFNIANNKNYSLLYIIEVIENLLGRKLERQHGPARTGDIRKTCADITKAQKLLGYKPGVNFEDGLKRTWEWFKQQ